MSENTTPPSAPTDGPDDDDLRTLLARRQHAKPTKTTWILLVLIAVAFGFALGACTQGALSSSGGARQPAPVTSADADRPSPRGGQ